MGDSLSDFIDEACPASRLRVEQDFGGGFVRLRLSEAEKRQAAQDIRSSEDAVLELLRNARDADARHIFLAFGREGACRSLVAIDDGAGIPPDMHERIFEPRVTSKLDTAHLDKWGLHGRGMALYSISVNAEEARVACSAPGVGSVIAVAFDPDRIGEKADQSTFPRFEQKDGGTMAMRGPRNILRSCAEFALEHRGECAIWCGSPIEVASALYAFGHAVTTPSFRAFSQELAEVPVVKRLACCPDPSSFAACAASLGLPLSERTARRILDGDVPTPAPLLDSLQDQLAAAASPAKRSAARAPRGRGGAGVKLAEEDRAALSQAVAEAYAELARRYYLEGDVVPEVAVRGDSLSITIPMRPID